MDASACAPAAIPLRPYSGLYTGEERRIMHKIRAIHKTRGHGGYNVDLVVRHEIHARVLNEHANPCLRGRVVQPGPGPIFNLPIIVNVRWL